VSTPFSSDDWRQLEPLIDVVLDAPRDQRRAVIAELTGGDPDRGARLAQLVAECESDLPLLRRPAAERFAALFRPTPAPVPESLAERYLISRELGRGGMATVYLARDVRHGRNVAVKVLEPEITATLGREQFLLEIAVVAQLRHPNIVPLFDSGEADGVLFYVMPYEEGQSLRERLATSGPVTVDDTIVMLRDVGEALAYAHGRGIVHRDVKPDNVLLSGRHAMVADFGLARVVTAAAEHSPLARIGLVLGTPAYMAPEYVTDDPRHVDHRADIYALGILAYELLVGRPPFATGSPQQILDAHVTQSVPPLAECRADVPDDLVAIVDRCLAKRPGDRWQTVDELLGRLERMAAGTGVGSPRRSRAVPWIAAAAVATAGVATLVVAANVARRAAPPAPALGRATQLTADRGLEVQPAISPDGRTVAYAAGQSLHMRVVVRPLAGGSPVLLTGDRAGNQWLPRWSPDGGRVLFLSDGGVWSAPAAGGVPHEEIASRAGTIVTSATWSSDGGEIVYVRGDSLLARRPATGVTRLITTGADLHSCSWAPNVAVLACVAGNSFFVTVGRIFGLGPMFGNLAPSRIVLIQAASGAMTSVTDSVFLHQSPEWAPDGRTLYYVSNRQGTRDVYALPMTTRGQPDGPSVRMTTGMGAHSIAVSPDGGRIVYAVYRSTANVWAMPIPDKPPVPAASAAQVTSGNQTVEGVRISGDRKWLIYDSDLSGSSDIYRLSLAGGEPERITRDSIDEFRGAASQDGKMMAYHTFHTGSRNVFLVPFGGGAVQQLTFGRRQLSMANWSPNGRALVFMDMLTNDVLIMRRDTSGRWGEPRFVARDGWRPEWSPDGKQVAFVSPSSGRIGIAPADSGPQRDLYVPGAGDPLAELAMYADNGRELYFKSHDAELRASFWSIPLIGGRPRLLVRFDDAERASNRFEFAYDGARFYFTIEDRQSDIWVAELARR
jgi:Tol biopolymer transport system component